MDFRKEMTACDWCRTAAGTGALSDNFVGCQLKTRVCIDHLTDPLRMDMDRSPVTESILHITLEIIYLLTGEDNTVMKKTSGEGVTPSSCLYESGGLNSAQSPIPVPPPHSLIHKRHNDQKILELTNKIIQLLTGEVPIRCEDVTVYFSMEEWEYIEEHRGLYKDVMMENYRPLTSLDGASNRNTPERCPRPLYSQEENHSVPQECKSEDLTNIKAVGEEETYVRGDQQCKEEEIPTDIGTGHCVSPTDGTSNRNTPERCPRPLYSQDHTEENHRVPQEDQDDDPNDFNVEDTQGEEMYVMDYHQCKEEEIPTDIISTDVASNGNTPERCPRPLYSQDHTEENHRVPQEDQDDDPNDFNVEDTQGEEMYVMDYHQCKEEEIPTDIISTVDGCFNGNTSRNRKEMTQDSPGENPLTPNTNPVRHPSPDRSDTVSPSTAQPSGKTFPCPDCDKSFARKICLLQHQRTHTGDEPFSCTKCRKSFTHKSYLVEHQRTHKGEKPFSCTKCRKSFTHKSYLVEHQRTHTGEKPFSCPECGKCFSQKSILVNHQVVHSSERPFVCSICSKCFAHKSYLMIHVRTHTGEKPFPCSECDKCFLQKSGLRKHQRTHTGEKRFSCTECGKSFMQKITLINHQRIHTGEKPFSCSQCEKRFSNKSNLIDHERVHTGEKPFSCSDCGKCFSQKSTAVKHQKIHDRVKAFSCSVCGKSFAQKSHLLKHGQTHAD
ncbi:zinc finger protein 34-like isoform X1 [Pseudophryne corroboree]|uniref:zinc finger protein 34-like isoform X1 n=2 Tax=Pseudophryne corroboree TaxID=495146 RepID=UPI0030818048